MREDVLSSVASLPTRARRIPRAVVPCLLRRFVQWESGEQCVCMCVCACVRVCEREREQLGRPFLPPQRLYSCVHHRARVRRQDAARVRQARRQDHRPLLQRHVIPPGKHGRACGLQQVAGASARPDSMRSCRGGLRTSRLRRAFPSSLSPLSPTKSASLRSSSACSIPVSSRRSMAQSDSGFYAKRVPRESVILRVQNLLCR